VDFPVIVGNGVGNTAETGKPFLIVKGDTLFTNLIESIKQFMTLGNGVFRRRREAALINDLLNPVMRQFR
jgi:hypothetical protein